MAYYNSLTEIDIVCFTLKESANEKLAKAESTEDKNLYLGEIRAYNKILNHIKEMKDTNDTERL